jgi:hypothetical protein
MWGHDTLGLSFLTALLTAALVVGLRALLIGGGERRPAAPGASRANLRLLGLTVVATLLAVTLAPVALLMGERPIAYSHLASATFQTHRYYLAPEQTPRDGSVVLLFRCDSLGVWCRELDGLGTTGEGQSSAGWLRYDRATRTIVATAGEHLLLTYAAGDLFEGQ